MASNEDATITFNSTPPWSFRPIQAIRPKPRKGLVAGTDAPYIDPGFGGMFYHNQGVESTNMAEMLD